MKKSLWTIFFVLLSCKTAPNTGLGHMLKSYEPCEYEDMVNEINDVNVRHFVSQYSVECCSQGRCFSSKVTMNPQNRVPLAQNHLTFAGVEPKFLAARPESLGGRNTYMKCLTQIPTQLRSDDGSFSTLISSEMVYYWSGTRLAYELKFDRTPLRVSLKTWLDLSVNRYSFFKKKDVSDQYAIQFRKNFQGGYYNVVAEYTSFNLRP